MTEETGRRERYLKLGIDMANLLYEKNTAYGDSFVKGCEILRVLYPDGVGVGQMPMMLATIRIVDKLFRVANDPEAFGEDPVKDIMGYAMLMADFMAHRRLEYSYFREQADQGGAEQTDHGQLLRDQRLPLGMYTHYKGGQYVLWSKARPEAPAGEIMAIYSPYSDDSVNNWPVMYRPWSAFFATVPIGSPQTPHAVPRFAAVGTHEQHIQLGTSMGDCTPCQNNPPKPLPPGWPPPKDHMRCAWCANRYADHYVYEPTDRGTAPGMFCNPYNDATGPAPGALKFQKPLEQCGAHV